MPTQTLSTPLPWCSVGVEDKTQENSHLEKAYYC